MDESCLISMSHVPRTNEACQIWIRFVAYTQFTSHVNGWVMSHTLWVNFTDESCPAHYESYHTHESCPTHHESCPTHESYIYTHVTHTIFIYIYTWHTHDSCLIWIGNVIWMGNVAYSHVPHTNEAYQIRMGLVTNIRLIWVSHVTHEWVMSRMNESCLIWISRVTYERVMPHMNGSRVMGHVAHRVAKTHSMPYVAGHFPHKNH